MGISPPFTHGIGPYMKTVNSVLALQNAHEVCEEKERFYLFLLRRCGCCSHCRSGERTFYRSPSLVELGSLRQYPKRKLFHKESVTIKDKAIGMPYNPKKFFSSFALLKLKKDEKKRTLKIR